MIYIQKNNTTSNIMELTEISSLFQPYYLFEFTNDFNKSVTYFHCPDSSSVLCRYNQFDITETGATSTILSAGTVNLTPGGYSVNIYEATAVTLSISGTTGRIVTTNLKAFVEGIEPGLNEIYQ